MEKLLEAVEFINSKNIKTPEMALVLGSGLGDLAEEIENKVIIDYKEIPGFSISTVSGHKGRLVFGSLMGKQVVMMQGRLHYYEGHSIKDIAFPIRVFKKLGIKNLIVTNAAGAVNKNYNAGDLVIIKDHINMLFNNPLMGQNDDEFGPRFPDMSEAYTKSLRELALAVGSKLDINLREGVYACMTGPNYETPAEVRMLSVLGADVVGMSTVPEVLVARHSGMSVLGISCATNMAAGILDTPLNHKEVLETGEAVKNKFSKLIKEIIKEV